MAPVRRKEHKPTRVMPPRASRIRGELSLREAVRDSSKNFPEPESRESSNVESWQPSNFWRKKSVRRFLPRPCAKPTILTKQISAAATALAVSPEMIRSGAIKAAQGKKVDDRPVSCGENPPVIKLADYVARGFGQEALFWMELSVRKILNDVIGGFVDQRAAGNLLGVNSVTMRKKLDIFKELRESEIGEEPVHDSDGDIVCDDESIAFISAYDAIRMKNIKEKTEMFKSLGLDAAKASATRKRGFTWRTVHGPTFKEEVGSLKKVSKNTAPCRVMPQRVTKLTRNAFREFFNGEKGGGARGETAAARAPHPVPPMAEMPLDEFITLDSNYLSTRHGLRWLSVKTTCGEDQAKNTYSLDFPDGILTKKNMKLSKWHLTACSIYSNSYQPRLNLVAVGDKSGVVTLWTPETTVRLRTHSESVSSLEFYGTQVVTASPDGHIRSIDLENLTLQDVFDAKRHFGDKTSSEGQIAWHKTLSNSEVIVGYDKGTVLLYDVLANTTATTIVTDGTGSPAALNTGNNFEICVPCHHRLAFVDIRMPKSDSYTKIHELNQQPIAVEYSDFDESILVSLISDEDNEGRAVVLALDSGDVEADIPAAINNMKNAAIWHPDKAGIVFLPYAFTNGGHYESTLAAVDLDVVEKLTLFGDTFSNPDFSLSTAVDSPMMAVLNSGGKGSLRILANHNFDLGF